MEIEAEITTKSETRIISTLDWKDPLYLQKPGKCEKKIAIKVIVIKS